MCDWFFVVALTNDDNNYLYVTNCTGYIWLHNTYIVVSESGSYHSTSIVRIAGRFFFSETMIELRFKWLFICRHENTIIFKFFFYFTVVSCFGCKKLNKLLIWWSNFVHEGNNFLRVELKVFFKKNLKTK